MTDETVILRVDKLIHNARGNEVPDMLDVSPNTKADNQPRLTVGSLIANAFYTGIQGANTKDALKYFKLAGRIEDALKSNDGKLTVTRAELDQLEESWGKINVPVYTIPMYAGAVQQTIDDAKIELLTKEKAAKAKNPPSN